MNINFKALNTKELKKLANRKTHKGLTSPIAWAAKEELHRRSNQTNAGCYYDFLLRKVCGNRNMEFYFS